MCFSFLFCFFHVRNLCRLTLWRVACLHGAEFQAVSLFFAEISKLPAMYSQGSCEGSWRVVGGYSPDSHKLGWMRTGCWSTKRWSEMIWDATGVEFGDSWKKGLHLFSWLIMIYSILKVCDAIWCYLYGGLQCLLAIGSGVVWLNLEHGLFRKQQLKTPMPHP